MIRGDAGALFKHLILVRLDASRLDVEDIDQRYSGCADADCGIIRLRPRHANHVWSIDFVHDKLSNGRPYKMLTVLDEQTTAGMCHLH